MNDDGRQEPGTDEVQQLQAKCATLQREWEAMREERDLARRAAAAAGAEGPWVWTGTADDHLASLGEDTAVRITGGQLRQLVESARDGYVPESMHEELRQVMLSERRRAERAEDDKARCRTACQTLLTELVSIGPENVESAAERAVQEIRRLRAEVESAREQWAWARGRIGTLLSVHGCDCECDCSAEEHDDDCNRCLACQIAAALAGPIPEGE